MSNEITVFKQFEADLVTLEESNAGMEFDDTPEGIADRRKWYRKLRKGTNGLDKIRKEAGAEYLRLGREVNAEAKTIQVRLDVMELPHKTVLDEIEAAEQKVIDDLAAAAEALAEYEKDERLAWLEYRERKVQAAEDAAKATADAAQQVLDDAETKRLADEATAKAVADAVLETERKAHEAKGELAAKHLKEKNDAQAVIDIADKAKAALVADVKHRTKIHLAIKESISGYTTNEANADFLIAAISDGRIPYVQINYETE